MPDKHRILLYGALAVCSALYAVPQLVNPGHMPFGGGAADSALPVDDGFFASGFAGVASGSGAPARDPSAVSANRDLASQLELALGRMERAGRVPNSADAPKSPVALTVEPQLESSASANSRVREETEARAREALHTYLVRHPVRGAVLGGSGSALLLQGTRLGLGDTLGQSGWSLAEVDNRGAVFMNGRQRVRADLPRGPRAVAASAAPTAPSSAEHSADPYAATGDSQ